MIRALVAFLALTMPARAADPELLVLDWAGFEVDGLTQAYKDKNGGRLDAESAELLPRAPRWEPADLVAAGEAYARFSGYPIQYQWTLIEGVNDGDDEIEGIVALLSGKYALMNLIPFNTVPGMPWRRPSWERAAQMARQLHRRGILTKLRHSAGQDVDAGCGQLRARTAPGGEAVVRLVPQRP